MDTVPESDEYEPSLDKRDRRIILATLGFIASVLIGDIVSDWREGSSSGHLATEAVLLVSALAGLGRILLSNRQMAAQARVSDEQLQKVRNEAFRWRREASQLIEGLANSIDAELERWQLTAAEKEIALLMLKGLSHKEIASLREVSEQTVRRQAFSIYQKSGVSGRAELCAYFLEDLLTAKPKTVERTVKEFGISEGISTV